MEQLVSDEYQTASPDQDRVWHPEQTLKRMGDDAGLLLSMINYFGEDAPELLRKLTSALEEKNAEEATRIAHSLKGLCANYDGTAGVDKAHQIESLCRAGDLNAAVHHLPELRQRVDELGAALLAWHLERQS